MPNFIPVPPELQSLIEKRELADRRQDQRRQEPASEAIPEVSADERRQAERRQDDRRNP